MCLPVWGRGISLSARQKGPDAGGVVAGEDVVVGASQVVIAPGGVVDVDCVDAGRWRESLAGPATTSRRSLRRGRSPSCVANVRLGHDGAGRLRRASPCVLCHVSFNVLHTSMRENGTENLLNRERALPAVELAPASGLR